MFKISGTVKMLNDTVQISERFAKREFVIQTGEMYPQSILFQSTQDKCSLLDGVQVGEQIEVSFDVKGREWVNPQGETKYFNSLEAWRIDKVGQNASSGTNPTAGFGPMNEPPSTDSSETNEEEDDLPF
jgi:hypothetical protein